MAAPATCRRSVPAVRHARRRMVDPTTCEREYRPEELEFMQALDRYKRSSGRMFPTCSEILEVVHALGYVRHAAAADDGMCGTSEGRRGNPGN